MRPFILSLILFFNISNLISQNNTFDVRNTKWGMTMDEVIKSEGLLSNMFIKGSDGKSIEFETNIDGRKVIISYGFNNNRLETIHYTYYWGNWQTTEENQNIKNRIYSLSSMFTSFDNKQYRKAYGGTWEDGQEGADYEYSKQFKSCQLSPFDVNNITTINKFCSCYNSAIQNKNFRKITLYYRTERTYSTITFPTENYWDGYQKIILGWVYFKSMVTSSDF